MWLEMDCLHNSTSATHTQLDAQSHRYRPTALFSLSPSGTATVHLPAAVPRHWVSVLGPGTGVDAGRCVSDSGSTSPASRPEGSEQYK